jgi:hypothetical protein
MKKLLIIITLSAVAFNLSYSQTQKATTEDGKTVLLNSDGTWKYTENTKEVKTSTNSNNKFEILEAVDKMTDKHYYKMNEDFLLKKDQKSIEIMISIGENAKYDGLTVYYKNIGGCNEKNKLIFLFEDNSKISLSSWNDFNCKDYSYFDLRGKELANLQKKVISVMFQNGRTYDSSTIDVPIELQDYFIKAKECFDNKVIVPAHFDDNKIIKD